MSNIQYTGLGSGMDVNSIVDRLIAAEADGPTKKIEKTESKARLNISAYGKLSDSLGEFKDSLKDLSNLSKFNVRTATVTNSTSATDSYFTVDASGNAADGSFDVEVVTLARAHKLSSRAFNNEFQGIGTGTLNITVGNATHSIDITSADDSVSGIRQKINKQSGITGLSVTTLVSDTGTRLIFTAAKPGLDNQISITVQDDDGDNTDNAGLSQLINANLTVEQAAVDAVIRIDGHAVTRSSNNITGAVDGLTFNLLEADPGNAHRVTVAKNTKAAKDSIDKFIESYNKLFDTINDLSGANDELFLLKLKENKSKNADRESKDSKDSDSSEDDEEENTDGALFGDSTLRNIQTRLRDSITTQISNTIGYSSLAAIGIVSEAKTGKLQLSKNITTFENKLDISLKNNFDAVGRLFGGENGVSKKLHKYVDKLLAFNGSIKITTDEFHSALKKVHADRVKLLRKLENTEKRLLKQFSFMDSQVGKLKNIGTYLEQSLTNIGRKRDS